MPHDAKPPVEMPVAPVVDQTSPQMADWRSDLAETAIVAGAVGFLTLLIGIALVVIGTIQTLAGFATFLFVLVALVYIPFAVLAVFKVRSVVERNRLSTSRSRTERRLLDGLVLPDLDDSGSVDEQELQKFLEYVRHMYLGGDTTADAARRKFKLTGPEWQQFRDAMVSLGLAFIVKKKGGEGFEFNPRARLVPYRKLEAHIRRRYLPVLPYTPMSELSGPSNVHSPNVHGKMTLKNEPRSGEVQTYAHEPITTLPPDTATGDETEDEWQ